MGCACLTGDSVDGIYALRALDVLDNRVLAMVNAGFNKQLKIIQDPSYAYLLKMLNAIPEILFVKFATGIVQKLVNRDPCWGFNRNKNFINWGKTVQQVYDEILYPTDIDPESGNQISEIQHFVRQKVGQGKKIRGAGIRHSWGNIFADPAQCIVSFYPYEVAKGTSKKVELYALQLQSINETFNYSGKQFLGTIKKLDHEPILKNGKIIHLVKIGSGVSNEQLRRWCIKNHLQYKSNVIMVEVNVCGGLGTCSHGSGIETQTLADYIYEIQFIDYKGVRRIISKKNNPDLIKSAASSLGLLGLMVFITMELEELQIIKSEPRKLFKDFVIPWPKEEAEHRKEVAKASRQWALYLDIDQNIKGQKGERTRAAKTSQQKKELTQKYFGQDWQQAWQDNLDAFKEAISKTYNQWFYFVREQVHIFENCWSVWDKKNDQNVKKIQRQGLGAFVEEYPSPYIVFLSEFGSLALQLLANHTPTQVAVNIMLRAPYVFFPHKNIYLNYVDGIHFQRGIQNMRVRDFQVQINVPMIATKGNQKEMDYNFIQKIWWTGKDVVDKHREFINMAIEMRIFKGSEATLAPEYGYQYVCSVQILRTMILNNEDQLKWRSIIVEIFQAWKNLRDINGDQVVIRPHWGKEWDFIPEVKNHLFQEKKMKENIRKFMEDYKKICKYHNMDHKQNLKTFSNKIYKQMINNAVDEEDRIIDNEKDRVDSNRRLKSLKHKYQQQQQYNPELQSLLLNNLQLMIGESEINCELLQQEGTGMTQKTMDKDMNKQI